MGAPASFYFDLASPLAYFAAERVLHALPGPAEWQPVLAAELPGAERFDAFRCEQEERRDSPSRAGASPAADALARAVSL